MKNKLAIKSMLSIVTATTVFAAVSINTFAAGNEVIHYPYVKYSTKEKENSAEAQKNVYNTRLPEDLTGKTVIIATNDVHGAIKDYIYVERLKNEVTKRGGTVVLVDSGDFSTQKDELKDSNNDPYPGKSAEIEGCLDKSNGIAAVEIMNELGYDVVCLGNHEFERREKALSDIIDTADFPFVLANVQGEALNKKNVTANKVVTPDGTNLKIGFFGLETPSADDWVEDKCDLEYRTDKTLHEVAQEQVADLKSDKNDVDIVICLAHLGFKDENAPKNLNYDKNITSKEKTDYYKKSYADGERGVDLYADVTGIDLIIDGHSHTTVSAGANGENIMSTGIQFQNIGVIIIDNDTKKIKDKFLIPDLGFEQIGRDEEGNLDDSESDKLEAYINTMIKKAESVDENDEKAKAEFIEYIKNLKPEDCITTDVSSAEPSDGQAADAASTEFSVGASSTDNSTEEASTEATESISNDSEDQSSTSTASTEKEKKPGKGDKHRNDHKKHH